MKLFGLALLLFSAFVISREYTGYVKKHLAESEGFISFIKHMIFEVKCYLKPPREIVKGFHNEAIEPFLNALLTEESMYSAFEVSRLALSLSGEECRVLEELFSSIGTCYADDGVRLLDSSVARLSELNVALRSDGLRSARIFGIVSTAVSVGLFILLI